MAKSARELVKRPRRPVDPPFWRDIAEPALDAHIGKILSIEEIKTIIPPYRNNKALRGRTIISFLYHRLEIIERGPNGALGHGSSFKVLPRVYNPIVGSPFGDGFIKQMEERADIRKHRKAHEHAYRERTRNKRRVRTRS